MSIHNEAQIFFSSKNNSNGMIKYLTIIGYILIYDNNIYVFLEIITKNFRVLVKGSKQLWGYNPKKSVF